MDELAPQGLATLDPAAREAADRLLLARARQLAAGDGRAALAERPAGTEMLIVRLHDEWYAIELARLSAVHPTRGITPLPGLPAAIAGMLNVRGTIVTVLDLARGLRLPAAPAADGACVLLADVGGGGGRGTVGLLVAEVRGVQRLALDHLDRSLSGDLAVRGIAEAGIVVLDLAVLLTDGRFEVAEER